MKYVLGKNCRKLSVFTPKVDGLLEQFMVFPVDFPKKEQFCDLASRPNDSQNLSPRAVRVVNGEKVLNLDGVHRSLDSPSEGLVEVDFHFSRRMIRSLVK